MHLLASYIAYFVIPHLLIHEDFKSLSEKEEIFLDCSICKSKKAQKIGVLKTTLADISKILEETEPIRTEKKKRSMHCT